MSLSNKIIKHFNKKGFRWVISLLFKIASYYKTKTINKLKYDKINNKWMQYHKDICYNIDVKPNWNISIPSLVQYVNVTNFVQYQPKNGDVIIDIGAGIF